MFSTKPKATQIEDYVEAATNENLTQENWAGFVEVQEKLQSSSDKERTALNCISAIQKRLVHPNNNVKMYALALSDFLVKNGDITVHREISSRAFTDVLKKVIKGDKVHESVRERAKEFIQMCAFQFREDQSLGLMNDVCNSLRAEGIKFAAPHRPKKEEYSQAESDKQKEEEEYQLALALSLSESENRPVYKASASTAKPQPTEKKEEPKASKVRALYDFQPTEEGELGFQKGDVIRVVESVYRDWWKGELGAKKGIFPVNYVEKIVDPSPADLMKEAQTETEVLNEIRNVERLLEMLDNPNASVVNNDEFTELYQRALRVRPKLIGLIEKYSMKKDELVNLNDKFVQAKSTYEDMLNSSIARYTTASTVTPAPVTEPTNYYTTGSSVQPQHSGYGYPPPSSAQHQIQTSPPMPQQHPQQQQQQPEQNYYPYPPQQQAPYSTPQSHHQSPYPQQPSYS